MTRRTPFDLIAEAVGNWTCCEDRDRAARDVLAALEGNGYVVLQLLAVQSGLAFEIARQQALLDHSESTETGLDSPEPRAGTTSAPEVPPETHTATQTCPHPDTSRVYSDGIAFCLACRSEVDA